MPVGGDMAISLKCVCGARLDIDDSFQGKKIPCPDCNRLLDTNPPLGPPRYTSGWALASLILPLVGMLTLILPITGAVCGFIALRQIKRDPTLGGVRFARAGIILGVNLAILSLTALTLGEFFNLDGMLRVFMAPREYARASGDMYVQGVPPQQETVTFGLRLPNRGWVKVPVKNADDGVDLTLRHYWFDMCAVCFAIVVDPDDDVRMKAIQRFRETKLAKDLHHDPDVPAPSPDQIKTIGESKDTGPRQEFEVDLTLGGIPRVFLFKTWSEKSRLNVVVVGCRKSRFGAAEATLHEMLQLVKLDEVKN
jgi:hypothetical protein